MNLSNNTKFVFVKAKCILDTIFLLVHDKVFEKVETFLHIFYMQPMSSLNYIQPCSKLGKKFQKQEPIFIKCACIIQLVSPSFLIEQLHIISM